MFGFIFFIVFAVLGIFGGYFDFSETLRAAFIIAAPLWYLGFYNAVFKAKTNNVQNAIIEFFNALDKCLENTNEPRKQKDVTYKPYYTDYPKKTPEEKGEN